MRAQQALYWQIGNVVVSAVLQLLFLTFSSRLIPKEVHGSFAILNSLIFLASMFSEGGVGSALIQRKNINKRHVSIAFYFSFLISIILFALLFFSAEFFESLYSSKITANHVRFASTAFIAMTLGKISGSLLIRNFEFKKIFIVNSVSYFVAYILVGLVLAYTMRSLWAFIIALIMFHLIKALLNYYYYRHSFNFHFRREEFRQIFDYGSSFTVLRLIAYITGQVDKIILGKLISANALGVFEKSQFISKMPSKYIGISINSVLFSYLSKIAVVEKKNSLIKVLLVILILLSGNLGIILYYNSDLIVYILLGESWLDVSPLLRILAWNVPLMLVAMLCDIVVRSENIILYSIPIKFTYALLIMYVLIRFYDFGLESLFQYLVLLSLIHTMSMLLLISKYLKINWIDMLSILINTGPVLVVIALKYCWIKSSLISDYRVSFFMINILLDVLLQIVVINFILTKDVKDFIFRIIAPVVLKMKKW